MIRRRYIPWQWCICRRSEIRKLQIAVKKRKRDMYELTEMQRKTEQGGLLPACPVVPNQKKEPYDCIAFGRNVLLEYQVLNAGRMESKERKMQTASQKQDRMTDMAKERMSILDYFFEIRTEDVLEKRLKEDRSYQEINAEARREIAKIEKMELSREQWLIIDNALSACNKRSSCYGRMAYKQGFLDAIHLLKALCQLV